MQPREGEPSPFKLILIPIAVVLWALLCWFILFIYDEVTPSVRGALTVLAAAILAAPIIVFSGNITHVTRLRVLMYTMLVVIFTGLTIHFIIKG